MSHARVQNARAAGRSLALSRYLELDRVQVDGVRVLREVDHLPELRRELLDHLCDLRQVPQSVLQSIVVDGEEVELAIVRVRVRRGLRIFCP